MMDKFVIGMMIALVVAGLGVIVYTAKIEQEFIVKCQDKGGIPKIGKGIMLCLNPNANIEVN